jgi:hypothetical protein
MECLPLKSDEPRASRLPTSSRPGGLIEAEQSHHGRDDEVSGDQDAPVRGRGRLQRDRRGEKQTDEKPVSVRDSEIFEGEVQKVEESASETGTNPLPRATTETHVRSAQG